MTVFGRIATVTGICAAATASLVIFWDKLPVPSPGPLLLLLLTATATCVFLFLLVMALDIK